MKHTHPPKSPWRIATDFSVVYHGQKVPKGGIYGLFPTDKENVPYIVTGIYNGTLQVQLHMPWKSWELHRFPKNSQFVTWLTPCLSTLPKNHSFSYGLGKGITATFQKSVARRGKSTALKQVNVAYGQRADNSDFKHGEYNYNSPYRKTIVYY